MKIRLFLFLFPLLLLLFLSDTTMPVRGVTYWHMDKVTKGNWIEKIDGTWFKHYGKDGYILCGFESQGHNDAVWQKSYDRYSLPSYITDYRVSGTGGSGPLPSGKAGVYTVAAPTDDPRALVDPEILGDPNVLSKRRNTHWFTTPYDSGKAALYVDLQFSSEACNKYFFLSLYFLDADQYRRLNVTVTDEDPSNPKSVSVVLETGDTQGGVYLVFTVYGPTKLKIKLFQGYNCNPCISGIFIDKIADSPPPFVIPEVPLGTVSALTIMLSPIVLRERICRHKRPK